MLFSQTDKGISLVEVIIAMFLTTTAILGIFSLQAPAWHSMSKADYLGRASEIMHRQLESTEVYLMNQCNTSASTETGIPAVPGQGASASAAYAVQTSGLTAHTRGDIAYTVTTTISGQTANYFRVTVNVKWPPVNSTGISQTIYVARQQYFKNGC